MHLASSAVLRRAAWPGQDIRDGAGDLPLAFDSPYPYCRTKTLAEQAVREANAPGFETVVLRPRFIWGPGDQTILPTVRAMAQSGGWMWVDGGRAMTSTVHIDNLVDAIELALEKGRPGEPTSSSMTGRDQCVRSSAGWPQLSA